MSDTLVEDRIAAARLEKAKRIAAWLQAQFLVTALNLTPDERQNVAVHCGVNARTPPSDESWAIVMEILRGAK